MKIKEAGPRIISQKRIELTKAQAGGFYAIHKEGAFYSHRDCILLRSKGFTVFN
nr:hypothetical protein [Candidatus Paracaedibacter acanthamoebae]